MAPKIAVIFYSLYNHTLTMSETAVKAATEAGAEVKLFQVPETLNKEILGMLHAAPRREDIPTVTPDDLPEFDGFIFVIPTRYGRAVGQFSAFFDMTGGLWMGQKLNGKFATVMTSTGTQNGGQETTALTTLPFFTHHGIAYVPFGYVDPAMLNMDELKGGAPWGAGTLAAGDGSRQPSVLELGQVGAHAKHFTSVVSQFAKGGQRLAVEKTKGASAPKGVKDTKEEATGSSSPKRTASSGSAASSLDSQGQKKKRNSIFSKVKRAFSGNKH